MKCKNLEIEKLYELLSRMSREAYKDELLMSNVIFSKQESRGRMLEAYLGKEVPPRGNFLFVVKKLLLYFTKNIFGLIGCVLTALLHWVSGQKFRLDKEDELVILDTYFSVGNILDKGEFEDTYFPGLSEYLVKIKKPYVYVPKWFGLSRPLELFKAFRILRKSQVPALTQYQVLGFVDYLKTLRFLIIYPFSVFRFMRNLGSSYEDKFISYGLWNVFDGVVIEHYMRFLLGQRLSTMISGQIKCLSWYENLVADKNFYSGLRSVSGKSEIIGLQLFVRPDTLMNIVPDEQEIPFKVVPDKVLVNGPGYCFESKQVRVEVGPALRYKHLFDAGSNESSREFVLVVLPYWDHVVSHMLNVILEVDWTVPVIIKFHPTMDSKKYKTQIPEQFSVTDEALPLLLPRALMAVGHSTGALIEAAALGIPAIDINHPERFSHDYMPEIGKGILWGQADNAKEVELLVKQFQSTLKDRPEQLKAEGGKMRSFCFSEPTEELMRSSFELD